MSRHGHFVWYELATTDRVAAERFYADILGWTARDAGMPGLRYTVMDGAGTPVAGIFTPPDAMRPADFAPFWLGYVAVPDVDAAAAQAERLGATLHAPPTGIPGVGRFTMMVDPQGAVITAFRGEGEPPPIPFGTALGHGGWHELVTHDHEAVFDFYAALFGWTKADAVDIGPMGTYQLFAAGGVTIGGMMNASDKARRPTWSYYFTVADIDAAAERVRTAGGTVVSGPHPVPGGQRILQVRDGQGAAVALVTPAA